MADPEVDWEALSQPRVDQARLECARSRAVARRRPDQVDESSWTASYRLNLASAPGPASPLCVGGPPPEPVTVTIRHGAACAIGAEVDSPVIARSADSTIFMGKSQA